jgi:SAM-dependent methyltransferase
MKKGNIIKSIIPRMKRRSEQDLLKIPLARGYFERIEYQDDTLTISGWMLLPKKNFNSFVLYINQRKVEGAAPMEREDIAKVYSFIPHAKDSGFCFSLHRDPEVLEGTIDICVVGTIQGREIAKIETRYQTDLYSCLPVPPTYLMSRVTGCEVPSLFLNSGMQAYSDFWTTVSRYIDPHEIRSMLDWGCGCARITVFFLELSGISRICGCDIDTEAIAWCQANLKPAEFSVIPPHPPTAYDDNAFDLIVSFSVFTHLSRDVQFSWLKEMQRILIPGGLFLATVHGEFAAQFKFPEKNIKKFLKEGIFDGIVDGSLDGIAPKGYYRAVFQSQDYTLKEWSRYFEILDYIEAGGGHYQDLIVMRRRSNKV